MCHGTLPHPYHNRNTSHRIASQIPDSGLTYLSERILLFRHDYNSPNVLHIINSAADIADETLVEIVLVASRK